MKWFAKKWKELATGKEAPGETLESSNDNKVEAFEYPEVKQCEN